MRSNSNLGALLATLLVAALPAAWMVGTAVPASAVDPVANPPIEDSCGIDVTLVLDASGSIQNSNAVDAVRGAAAAFLDSLKNTDSTARVTQFATVTQELAPATQVDDTSLAPDGALANAVGNYYNPRPPLGGRTAYQYGGSGGVFDAGNWDAGSSDQYTNWDGSLDQAGQGGRRDLVVYVTDGDPTAYDFEGNPPDPFAPPAVGYRTDRTSQSRQVTLDRAVLEANQVKAQGTRMLAVGVGAALQSSDSQNRLRAISGPQVVTDASTITDLNQVDVALVRDFNDLAQALRSIVLELCSPSLTIRKLAQSPGDATYAPAEGWETTVEPTVPGGYEWVLPNPGPPPPNSQTDTTDAEGFSQFQWEPTNAPVDSVASVTEALQPDYLAGRPDDDDWRCQLKDEQGNVSTESGEFDLGDPDNPTFTLDPIGEEIVTCTLYNSYDYDSQIALEKRNDPPQLRGDLDPPAEVTSTYTVTNPGNTPLTDVVVTDDQCAPAPVGSPNAGDTNRDNLLDPGEEWQFSCVRPVSTSPSTDPDGQTITNTAEVVGLDPAGVALTDEAAAAVVAYNPGIALVKSVSEDIVSAGEAVDYEFLVTNTGNTPLDGVSLTDVSVPDTSCVPTLADDGDGDSLLAPGESWTYECTDVVITASTDNQATVEANPLNPEAPDGSWPPYPSRTEAPNPPNPPVTDTDPAEVDVVDPDLSLDKSVDQAIVFPGTDVTYSYEATNEGDIDLRNDTGDPAWVTDDRCSAVAQQEAGGINVGDVNQDDLLNPGETWLFACTATITEDTINTAEIVAQPVEEGTPVGEPLVRTDQELVEVVSPGIALIKTALVGVVLDDDPTPFAGPDVPSPRPASYRYDVSNTGDVPLKDLVLTDDTCASVVVDGGDANGDGFLDVDETWSYTCETPLTKEQSDSSNSGLVTNTASVTGTPFLPPDTDNTAPDVTDQDTAQVLVIEPGIAITKTASDDVVLRGTAVTYTIEVTNTGDVGLDVLGPVDDKCDPLQLVDKGDGDDILEGTSAGGAETWTYECTREIGLPTAPETVDENVATVVGIDPLGNKYDAEDTAEVRVIDPAIDLTKTVSETLVPRGTTVDYTFEVTNVGTSPIPADDVLAEVGLVDEADPKQPSCASPAPVDIDQNGNGFLDREPAEVWLYECSASITDPTVNVAAVGAFGGTQFGGSNDGATQAQQADDSLRVFVFDLDAQFVQPFTPGIDVVKSAEPAEVFEEGEVTYTYEVTNTGDVPLAGVAEGIADDTCSPVEYVSGDEDGDGLLDTPTSIFEDSLDETWIFTCTTTVTETTTNTVVVPGKPTDPGGEPLCEQDDPALGRVAEDCDVDGTDTETVTVTKPGTIVVEKRTEPASGQSFDFTIAGVPFSLTDGESSTFEELEPGQYTIVETLPEGWTLADIVCDDPTGDTGVDTSTGSAVVQVAEAETVRCSFTNEFVPTPEKPQPLPPTGSNVGPLIAAAGLLLAGGASALLASRRRQHLS